MMVAPAEVRIDENGDKWVRYNYPPGSDTWVEVNTDQIKRTHEEWASKSLTLD